MKDKDYLIALGIGEAIALILLAISGNIDELARVPFLWLAIFVLPLLSMFGIWLAKILGRWFPAIFQFAKFALSGAGNVFIDLGILNLLIWVFGKSSGWTYPIFKSGSATIAIVNSYLLNRFWTFKHRKVSNQKKQFIAFYFWTGVSFLLNVGIASFIVNIIGPQWQISPKIWANIGAMAAVLLVCAWNFLGYKFIIFKK